MAWTSIGWTIHQRVLSNTEVSVISKTASQTQSTSRQPTLEIDIQSRASYVDQQQAIFAFDIFDVDGNGYIDQSEFTRLVNYPGLQSDSQDKLSNDAIKKALDHIAISKDGKITKEQFCNWYAAGGRESAIRKSPTTRFSTALRSSTVGQCSTLSQNSINFGKRKVSTAFHKSFDSEPEQLKMIKKNIGSVSFIETFRRLGMQPTYYCFLCLENQAISDSISSFRLSTCGHRYCRECLCEYLVNSINNGRVCPVCFYLKSDTNIQCNVPISDCDILKIIPQECQNKYHKFKANKENKNNRQCPKCDATQLGNPKMPSMICINCGMLYCFIHGNAHPKSDCATYERKHIQEEKKSKVIIAKHCKPCPRCNGMITKNGGCNHMKCSQCQCSFCWICMQEIEDKPLPDHYKVQPGNIGNPCIGRQMEGIHTANLLGDELTWYRRVCWLIVVTISSLIFLILVCPISAILTIIFLILCGSCISIFRYRAEEETSCYAHFCYMAKSTFSGISFVIFSCIACLLCLPFIFCCMYNYGCMPSTESDDGADPWNDDDVERALLEECP